MASRIPLWDAPVRLFHWALAALVVFSYATGKIGGSWLEWHMRSGYAILDKQDLSTSQFQEQTSYKRAIEGELEKTMLSFLRGEADVLVCGRDTSASFQVDPRIYNFVFETSLKFFGSNRCGKTDSWIHGACHLKDGDARAIFKNVGVDLFNYGRIKMYLHANSVSQDDELHASLEISAMRFIVC